MHLSPLSLSFFCSNRIFAQALIVALLQKAMGTAHMSLERTMKQ